VNEKERRESEKTVVKDITFNGESRDKYSAMTVPRHSPFVLLVKDTLKRSGARVGAVKAMKPEQAQIIFRDSVRTAKKRQQLSIIKTICSVLFTDIITVYFDNHIKSMTTIHKQNVKADDMQVITETCSVNCPAIIGVRLFT
jgi:hypothetical protein